MNAIGYRYTSENLDIVMHIWSGLMYSTILFSVRVRYWKIGDIGPGLADLEHSRLNAAQFVSVRSWMINAFADFT